MNNEMAMLIDADELKSVIKEDWFLDILLTQTGKSDMAKKLVDLIDSVPLAYDVEKVVEELDEYITKIVGRNSALYQTIMRIVREGGVE